MIRPSTATPSTRTLLSPIIAGSHAPSDASASGAGILSPNGRGYVSPAPTAIVASFANVSAAVWQQQQQQRPMSAKASSPSLYSSPYVQPSGGHASSSPLLANLVGTVAAPRSNNYLYASPSQNAASSSFAFAGMDKSPSSSASGRPQSQLSLSRSFTPNGGGGMRAVPLLNMTSASTAPASSQFAALRPASAMASSHQSSEDASVEAAKTTLGAVDAKRDDFFAQVSLLLAMRH
jgi:hypothetical protein